LTILECKKDIKECERYTVLGILPPEMWGGGTPQLPDTHRSVGPAPVLWVWDKECPRNRRGELVPLDLLDDLTDFQAHKLYLIRYI